MRLRSFAAAIFLLAAIPAQGETDDGEARLAAAQDMLVAGHRDQLEAVRIDLLVNQAAIQLKVARPQAGETDIARYCAVLKEELVREDAPLMQLRARYYADHFTLAELREWTRLLQSGVGQKILAAEPDMLRDFYNVDAQWVADAMRRTAIRINGPQDGAKPL